MIVGYARVSTREQCFNGQLAELQAAGCAKVYSEKASGARGDRTELRKVIDRLQPGDVLVVTRLDRLARSTRDLLNVLENVKQAGAGFRSLKDTCRRYRQRSGDNVRARFFKQIVMPVAMTMKPSRPTGQQNLPSGADGQRPS
jgi:DNA invertase Pin-like site-specific DNA recombinase